MMLGTKKGYFTLEAAIFLPIFIIAIAALGYFIKIFSTAENITFSAVDETAHLAAQAYGVKAAPIFPAAVERRLRIENEQADNIKVSRFRYLYEEGGRDGLILLKLNYHIKIKLPLDLYDGVDLESRIKCRGFIGKAALANPMAFSEMETNGDSRIVWIFPMWGKKYHQEECTYIKANAKQLVLTGPLRKNYQPCLLCKPDRLPLGSLVYCFASTGKAYHQGSCKTIDKYAIEIEKEDALAKGYQPCSKCGGG